LYTNSLSLIRTPFTSYSGSSNSKQSSHSSQKKEDSQKNNNTQTNVLPIYQDPNKKPFFVPPMHTLIAQPPMKFPPMPYAVNPVPQVQPVAPNPQTEAQDKILKDQNFLSSDDKLYEGIIHHGLNLKNIFAECQFSEKLLGSYIFRAIKKAVYDPNTIIFEDEQTSDNSKKNNESDNFGIKEIEIVESGINDIIQDNGKVPKIPDTSSI